MGVKFVINNYKTSLSLSLWLCLDISSASSEPVCVSHARIELLVIFMDHFFFIADFSFNETVFFIDLFSISSLTLGVCMAYE
jgi:hypothetical protein